MDHETRKEIVHPEARIKELETRLAISSMPEVVSALIEDLQLIPDTEEDDKVTLAMMEEFIKDMGYQTRSRPEYNSIIFTDMFQDYALNILEDGPAIQLSLYVDVNPDADLNMISLIISTRDLSVDIRLDQEKDMIVFSLQSTRLKPDTYRDSIRFFIRLLEDSDRRLQSLYAGSYAAKKESFGKVVHS
ncbi:MAG: hypothetical protein IJ840_05645 [Bacteroidales bacterium]|nr:hypothetical protein [Bacteroidales bacterium]